MRPILILAFALLSAACSKGPQSVFVDPALSTMVPPDTTFLVGVRMDPLKKTALWQHNQSLPLFDRIKQQTGLDPRSDIWDILFASDGKSSVVLARGKFADHGLEPKLQREGVRRFSHKGYTILGDDRNGVAFMNSSTAIAGPLTSVRSIIDGRDQGRGGIPKTLESAVGNVSRASQVWFAGMGLPLGDANPNLRNFDKGLQTVWGSADFTNGLDAQVQGETATPADAKKLHDALKALAGFARLSTRSEQRQALRLLDNITITNKDRRVEVKLVAPADLLDELIKLAPGG